MNVLRRDFVVREPLLVGVLVLITIVFCTVTHTYSQAYDRRRNALGQQWFAAGDQALRQNRPAEAVEGFRTALLYDPQNWDYRLYLAEALTRAGRTKQALNYYQSLWQFNPKSGIVNLHLARLTAQSGQFSEAERYFNGALFGDWPDDAADHRRDALFELVRFYIERQDSAQAESHLIILAGNLPEDAVLHTRVADLFVQAADYQRALMHYRLAFQLDAKYLPSLYGAGKAAFHLGDYRAAETYLRRASQEDSAGNDVGNLLLVARAAAALNPFEPGLHESEKIDRVVRAYQLASSRLDTCERSFSAASPLPTSLARVVEQAARWKPQANARFLASHADQLESLFEFSAAVEKQSQSVCGGSPTPQDSALLALAASHSTDEK
jgi:tetratricopeptide (TPR) repeat protein